MLLVVVRVRGSINLNRKMKDTLKFLRLNRVNHCVIIPDTPEYLGMLQKAKDYITWGNISLETLQDLITKRGRLVGQKPLTLEHIKGNTSYKTIKTLAKNIHEGKMQYKEISDVNPIFRLAPPIKGYEGVKHAFAEGGALGNRREKINDLVIRML